MRELFISPGAREDVSCLADALLLGGERGVAPNLEIISFENLETDTIARLGSQLFARGALTRIVVLKFSYVYFDEQGMTDLMEGFRLVKVPRCQSLDCHLGGRAGCTIKKLDFN